MNITISYRRKNVPIEELIEDIRLAAKSLGQTTITTEQYNQCGKFHSTTITRKTGSWTKALSLAGLKLSRSPLNIPMKNLFENLLSVWRKLGKQPRYVDMNNHKLSSISAGTYEQRFGTWNSALAAFADYVQKEKPKLKISVTN